jgi:hypothetical protein
MERRLTTKLEHHCLEATTATTTTTTTTAQQQQQQQAFCFFSKIRFFRLPEDCFRETLRAEMKRKRKKLK